MGDEGARIREQLGALVRRIRRAADLSQRELARALRLSNGAVAQAETGQRDLPATVLMRAAELAGLRLALVGDDGREVAGMAAGAVRDRQGRHFPAHLDTRHGDDGWWHDPHRFSRVPPTYTFDRDRPARDARRAEQGVPDDHQAPRPGDSLEQRAQARRDAAVDRRRAADQAYAAEQRRLGFPGAWAPTCTCPADCDELLFPSGPLSPAQNAVPHVAACTCRCDVA